MHDTETAVRTRGGEIRQVLLSTALVELRAGLHAITTFVDITERKRADETVREDKSRLAAIIEYEPECIKVVDRGGPVGGDEPGGVDNAGGRIVVRSAAMAVLGLSAAPISERV